MSSSKDDGGEWMMRSTTLAILVTVLSGGHIEAQQRLEARDLRRAERGCRDGRGAAEQCRLAGAHHITRPGAEAGQEALRFLRLGCDGGDGQACRILAGAFENGRRDQRISQDHGTARSAASKGCELRDMPSCAIAERLGVEVETTSVEELIDLVFSIEPGLNRAELAEKCRELGGQLNDRRPRGQPPVRECTVSRPMESGAAGEVTIRVTGRGRRVRQVSVGARIGSRAIRSSDAIRALEQRVRTEIIDRAKVRWSLVRDPESPSYEDRFVPTEPAGVRVTASRYSATIEFDPRAYRAAHQD